MNDKVVNKAKFAMSYGSEQHKTRVLSSRSTKTATLRWTAAINGPKHHLDILVKDRDPDVRACVAIQGHKDHLDRLVNDKEPDVRMKVAQHGHPEHLDKLVNDPDVKVRAEVASNGQQHHVDKLMHDPHVLVTHRAHERQTKIKKFKDFVHSIKDDPLLKD